MGHLRLDLHEKINPHCTKCRNKDERRTKDGLCENASSVLDELPARCVGSWGYDKIYFLNQYFGIFGPGMKNAWDGKVDYFEICSQEEACAKEEGQEIDLVGQL